MRTGPVAKRIVREDLEAVHEVLDAGLAVGGLILVDNALGNGLVELTVLTCLITVLSSERIALLRTRAISLVRMRFFWDLMFAIGFGSFRVLTRSYYPASETRLLRSYGRVFYTRSSRGASRIA